MLPRQPICYLLNSDCCSFPSSPHEMGHSAADCRRYPVHVCGWALERWRSLGATWRLARWAVAAWLSQAGLRRALSVWEATVARQRVSLWAGAAWRLQSHTARGGGDRLGQQALCPDLVSCCTRTITSGHPTMGAQQERGWTGFYDQQQARDDPCLIYEPCRNESWARHGKPWPLWATNSK